MCLAVNKTILVAGLWLVGCLCACSSQESITEDTVLYEETIMSIPSDYQTGDKELKVRKWIDTYELPEQTFSQKVVKCYALFDSIRFMPSYKGIDKFARIDSINYLTIKYLKSILSEKQSLKYRFPSHIILTQKQSADGKIRFFSWNENTGSAMVSNVNIVQYQTAEGPKSMYLEWVGDTAQYPIAASVPTQVYRMDSGDEYDWYVLLTRGKACSNCPYLGAWAFCVTKDTLLIHQPVFDSISPSYTWAMDNEKRPNLTYKNNRLVYSYSYVRLPEDSLGLPEEIVETQNFVFDKNTNQFVKE